jgi:uncharacterized membrane-anchored protein YitT (DUF2179 family)
LFALLITISSQKIRSPANPGRFKSHSFFIVTQKPAEVSQALMAKFGSGVTMLKGMGGFSKLETDVLYLIVGRLDIQNAKEVILEIDENAFITIQNVQEQISKRHRQGHFG